MDNGNTYVHESAHAVAAWRFGARLYTIKVKPNGAGEVIEKYGGNWGKKPMSDPLTEDFITMWLAGPAAEMKITGRFFEWNGVYQREVRELIDRLVSQGRFKMPDGWDERDFFCEHSGTARVFCDDPTNWKLINNLAEELKLRGGFMTGKEAARFLEGHHPLGRPLAALPWQEHGDDTD